MAAMILLVGWGAASVGLCVMFWRMDHMNMPWPL